MSGNKNIVVAGSINMDVVNRVRRHPLPGETVEGLGTAYIPGGKGANQAVAAARMGGKVSMFGAVGNDAFGAELLSSLQRSGVDTGPVLSKPGTSGMAFITVDDEGENSIIISAGANGAVSSEDAGRFFASLGEAGTVLLQNEIPWETTRYVMEEARRRDIRVLLNPAPAFAVPAEALRLVSLLVLNESEAEAIAGQPAETVEQASRVADLLLEGGVEAVILTLGVQGSLYRNRSGQEVRTPAFPVKPVDTTAAGDTFIGAFAAASAGGMTIEAALRFASAAAAITVTQKGAQSSIPELGDVEALLARQG